MLTRASQPEQWQLLAKGTDPATGEPVAHVGRRLFTGAGDTVCIWRIVKRGSNWYKVGYWVSEAGYKPAPEPKGQKLSKSWQDRAILAVAERA